MYKKIINSRVSLLIIISQVVFLRCGYSGNSLKSQTEKLNNRFISNYNLFVELKDSCQLRLVNSKNKNTFLLSDLIEDSSKRARYEKLNLEQFVAYTDNNKMWFEIYFEDINDPNMYLSFHPHLDTTGGLGRNPLRAIVWQDKNTKDAWIIQQYYER